MLQGFEQFGAAAHHDIVGDWFANSDVSQRSQVVQDVLGVMVHEHIDSFMPRTLLQPRPQTLLVVTTTIRLPSLLNHLLVQHGAYVYIVTTYSACVFSP